MTRLTAPAVLLLAACGPNTSGGAALQPAGAPQQMEERATTSRLSLAYATPTGADGPTATLDLYQRPSRAPQPLVVLVHGGSWVSGDKIHFADAAPRFIPWWIERGYAVAAVNFRLASPVRQALTVSPKDQASDIAYALAWLHAHAEDYHLSTHGTVLVGYSSGAHLVALLGADERYVVAAGLDEQSIAATISLDVHAYDVPYALSLMVDSHVARNIPLITHLFGDTEEEQLSASPIAYIGGRVAPAMLVSVGPDPEQAGTHGHIVYEAAQHYATALRAAGHHATTFHDPSESHRSLAVGFGEDGDSVTEQVGAFLNARQGESSDMNVPEAPRTQRHQ